MSNIDINKLFPDYPNVAKGVKEMKKSWESGPRKVKPGNGYFSLQFIYAKSCHAFRVETAKGGKAPRLVICTGKRDEERGSPLVKGADEKDVQKLKDDFGIPENKDGKSDWWRSLTESTSTDFYPCFVKHALKMVNRS